MSFKIKEVLSTNNRDRVLYLIELLKENFDLVESVEFEVQDEFESKEYLHQLIQSDNWAPAVDPIMIVDKDSEGDKFSRASMILSQVFNINISKKKFLDFGCGEGHVAFEAAQKADLSVGYDIVDENWSKLDQQDNLILTNNWTKVEENGPYDFILIFDVLDHLKDENDVFEQLSKIKSVLKSNGKIYVRCHPWCSRHGTHLWRSLNKAYVHLCISEDKIKEMGGEPLHTIKIIHPLQTYEKWFSQAGFTIDFKRVDTQSIEPIFSTNAIVANAIKKNWVSSYDSKLASGKGFPSYQCQQEWINFILLKNRGD